MDEPENITEAIEILKTVIAKKYGKLRLPPNSDGNEILERCLRRRNFNATEAADQVHSYFKLLSQLKDIFNDNFFLPSINKSPFFDSFTFCVLNHKDAKGRPIIWVNSDGVPVETFCIDRAVAAMYVLLNELMRKSVENQKSGVVYIYNLQGFQFGHIRKLSFARIRAVASVLQGSVPVSFKAVHIIKSPAPFYYLYSMMKPLLGKKIRDRIRFHGNDLTEFHKCVDPSGLPDIVGGEKQIEKCVDIDFMKDLCTEDAYYTDLLKYGYTDQVLTENLQDTAKTDLRNGNKNNTLNE